jgi:hypothetical protein
VKQTDARGIKTVMTYGNSVTVHLIDCAGNMTARGG